jgi:hypothetical protein
MRFGGFAPKRLFSQPDSCRTLIDRQYTPFYKTPIVKLRDAAGGIDLPCQHPARATVKKKPQREAGAKRRGERYVRGNVSGLLSCGACKK